MFAFIFVVGITVSSIQQERQQESRAVAMISLLYSQGSLAGVTVKHVFDTNAMYGNFHNRCYPQTSALGMKYTLFNKIYSCFPTHGKYLYSCRETAVTTGGSRTTEGEAKSRQWLQSCSKGQGGG